MEVDLKFLEPVGKELKMLGKVKDQHLMAFRPKQIYPLVPDHLLMWANTLDDSCFIHSLYLFEAII